MKTALRSTQPSWVTHLTLLILVFVFVGIGGLPIQAQKKKSRPPAGTVLSKDIVFAEADGIELKLDIYRPVQKSEAPLPVVLWIHGGGWLKGSKDNCKAAFLAQHDFAVVSVGYRLTTVAQWPAQIEDCYTAVRWVRENADTYGFDPDRIGAWGGSAGAHLAAILGTRPAGKEKTSSRVQAVCDWYGPTDLLTMPPNVVSEKRTKEQVAQSNGAKLLGAPVPDIPEKAKDASAFYHVTKDDPPFLIMHGSADPGVPVTQSQRFHDALKKAGVASELVILEGAGHGGKEFQTQEVKETVRNFFEENL
ncbi:MAG: alpha/beta hydrolase [Verrucomicrobiales bacterium]|nr:alpha/beta hydrolase [Verrucomicrobiales bacterium]